jgi:branched-chain amino acid transport system ATP-binding protein/neutral amino acid transport system ATP-binding protein
VSDTILCARGLTAGYGEVDILHDVNVEVGVGSFVSVIGPNGAGKSTLLKTVYGLLHPRAGSVVFRSREGDEREIAGLRPHRLTKLGLNYVPQLANVFPNMSVQENLEVGAAIAGREAGERVARIVEMFPLLRERRRARAGTLSGGQRQMLALARALVTSPRLLLLDEPSAGLAPTVVDELFETLAEINRQGIAILMVEQNARRSLAMSDYGYVLDMGRNRFEGQGSQLVDDPKIAELYLGGSGRLAAARAELIGDGS